MWVMCWTPEPCASHEMNSVGHGNVAFYESLPAKLLPFLCWLLFTPVCIAILLPMQGRSLCGTSTWALRCREGILTYSTHLVPSEMKNEVYNTCITTTDLEDVHQWVQNTCLQLSPWLQERRREWRRFGSILRRATVQGSVNCQSWVGFTFFLRQRTFCA